MRIKEKMIQIDRLLIVFKVLDIIKIIKRTKIVGTVTDAILPIVKHLFAPG